MVQCLMLNVTQTPVKTQASKVEITAPLLGGLFLSGAILTVINFRKKLFSHY